MANSSAASPIGPAMEADRESQPNTAPQTGNATHINPQSPTLECLSILSHDYRYHDNGRVYCYEISPCTLDNKQYVELLHHDPSPDKLRQFWKAENAACHSRLVVVEDISYPLIERLCDNLELDALVLIQHLKGSGVNDDSLKPLVGSQCVGAFLGTSFVSTQWYRPVSKLLKDQQKNKGLSLHQEPWPARNSVSGTSGWRVQTRERLSGSEDSTDKETNIFRRAWKIGNPSIPNTDDSASTVPVAWEEKVTIHREYRGGVEFVVLLTDPLPTLSSGAGLAGRNIVSTARRGTGLLRPQRPEPISTQGTPKTPPILPYEHIAPRWTYQHDSRTLQPAAQNHPDEPRTAHLDMMSWMTNQCLRDHNVLSNGRHLLAIANPVEALFRIIFLDTMTLSDIFDNTLQEIRLASLEDSKLQASIGEWRRMLAHAQLRLPTLRTSVTRFIYDTSGRHPLSESDSNMSHDFWVLAPRARQRISAVIKRTEEVDTALRAELSVLESRKQLLESSSVARLTELAFVFVPLSFIASAFSMQVQELQSPPPLTTFVIAASLAVFLAYIVRLFLSSRAFGQVSLKVEETTRRYNQIPDGESIPTGAYMKFGVRSILFHLGSIYGVVFVCLGAIVWVWVGLGQADGGFKAALTLVVVLTLPLPAAVPIADDTVPRWLRKVLLRQKQRWQRQQQQDSHLPNPPSRDGRPYARQQPDV